MHRWGLAPGEGAACRGRCPARRSRADSPAAGGNRLQKGSDDTSCRASRRSFRKPNDSPIGRNTLLSEVLLTGQSALSASSRWSASKSSMASAREYPFRFFSSYSTRASSRIRHLSDESTGGGIPRGADSLPLRSRSCRRPGRGLRRPAVLWDRPATLRTGLAEARIKSITTVPGDLVEAGRCAARLLRASPPPIQSKAAPKGPGGEKLGDLGVFFADEFSKVDQFGFGGYSGQVSR
jgi:hypothetical protein